MEYLKVIFEEDGQIVKWKVYFVDENTALVEFDLKRNLEPTDLNGITPPDAIKLGFSSKTVIISGRGPIWFYAFIVHRYHIVRVLAIYDPRLEGAVIVASHDVRFKEGQVIPLNPL